MNTNKIELAKVLFSPEIEVPKIYVYVDRKENYETRVFFWKKVNSRIVQNRIQLTIATIEHKGDRIIYRCKPHHVWYSGNTRKVAIVFDNCLATKDLNISLLPNEEFKFQYTLSLEEL